MLEREREREDKMTHIPDEERKAENQSKFALQKVHPENKMRWPSVKVAMITLGSGAPAGQRVSPRFQLDRCFQLLG